MFKGFTAAVAAGIFMAATGAASAASLGLTVGGPVVSFTSGSGLTFGLGVDQAISATLSGVEGTAQVDYYLGGVFPSYVSDAAQLADPLYVSPAILNVGMVDDYTLEFELGASTFFGTAYANGALLTMTTSIALPTMADPFASPTPFEATGTLQAIQPIPVPAAALLLGTALAGLGTLRRKTA